MRAGTVFLVAMGVALVLLLGAIGATLLLHSQGQLDDGDAHAVLRLTRLLVLPVTFVAVGALLWHLVRFHQGAYARR